MKWIPITKEEDCPEKDSSEEYPKQYILRCKNDGGRGDYEVFKVTADEMWLTALGFDYFEYLDEQGEGWVPVSQLPETNNRFGDSEPYICLHDSGEQVVCWYNKNDGFWRVYNFKADNSPVTGITHYRKLLQPPAPKD